MKVNFKIDKEFTLVLSTDEETMILEKVNEDDNEPIKSLSEVNDEAIIDAIKDLLDEDITTFDLFSEIDTNDVEVSVVKET